MASTDEASVTTVMPTSIGRKSCQKCRRMARKAGQAVVQSVRVMGVRSSAGGIQKDA